MVDPYDDEEDYLAELIYDGMEEAAKDTFNESEIDDDDII